MAAGFGRVERMAATIAAGASLSGAVNTGGGTIVGVDIPAPNAWDSANVTFQASSDSTGTSAYSNLYDKGGTEYAVTVGAISSTGRCFTLGTAAIEGLRSVKVRSGTAAAAVNQTNAQTIYLLVLVD